MANTDKIVAPTNDTKNDKEQKLPKTNEELDSQLPALKSESARYYLLGIGFLLLQVLVISLFSIVYMSGHGIHFIEVMRQPPQNLGFDFVGGNASPFAIGFEILFWSFFGVTCQVAYQTVNVIISRQFYFLKQIVRWLGLSLFAMGVASAVIFALKVISINIGGVEIALANASLETIIAIAFILGFFNEESRKLLGTLRTQIVKGIDEKQTKEDEDQPKAG